MSSVAILGAGPAGMLAAYACERNGLEPVIFAAEARPSHVNDDMFLQRPLPDLEGHDPGNPDAVIDYIRWGTARGYAKKCYGRADAPVSWDSIKWGFGDAWWLEPIYERLFARYEGHIKERSIGYGNVDRIVRNYPAVLSTLPGPALCGGGHRFDRQDTWLVRHQHREYDPQRDRNEMIYNGQNRPDGREQWFRCSRLRGWTTFEYAMEPPANELGPDPIIVPGMKLTGNNCTCHPSVVRIGRWAQWTRGVLNHHAFEQATANLASLGLGKGA